MKKITLLISALVLLACFVAPPLAEAQGSAVNSTAINLKSSNGDTVLKVYTPAFFNGSTSVTVGAYYTTAGAADTVCTVQVYHSLFATPLSTAGLGNLVSTSALSKSTTAATLYKEETITVAAGISYLNVVVDRNSAASNNGKVQVYIKPGPPPSN